MDPGTYLTQAHPRISFSSGTAYGLAPINRRYESNDSTSSSAIFARSFGFFNAGVAPGSTFQFQTRIAGNQVGDAGGGGSTIEERASSVIIVLKTSALYYESRKVQVAFQLHDAEGRTRVLTTGLTLTMTMTVPSTTASQSTSCASPDATSGIGVCTMTVASDRFSTLEDVATIVSMTVKYSLSLIHI